MLVQTQNIESVKIKSIESHDKVWATTENGQVIELHITEQQKTDRLFWESLINILRAELWLPLQKRTHELLQNDWLTSEPTLA
ncbi:hypothetical protein [Latilactobacillus fuchuensis]|uniref:Uncharacterized protein n=2 Tax=Latilactobacillus fuchuensis TaxID=164393 RepID=A0A2N9DW52_9LACO|nr:hypothetical protein [Latilactobacillus fuchuensis]KRL59409.1 hypothetical protein FC69_GL001662 [Latilactobacillus fuchuensis DSM 14340 = JCM 11249]MCP8858344.1 hypothetical protein [Latilactobacillus fuchuensis]SPC38769.1 conserved hypothetical protein [Latilactobacillus fuchuensis]